MFEKIKLTFLVSLFTCFAYTFFIYFVLFHAPSSTWSWLFDKEIMVLIDGFMGTQNSSKEFLTLKDIWAYQASLYELIITTLIGINAVVAVLAFIYINGRSKEDAREEAHREVQVYLNSEQFAQLWRKKVNKDFSMEFENMEEFLKKAIYLESELHDVKKDIQVISRRIAEFDVEEQESNSLLLDKVK